MDCRALKWTDRGRTNRLKDRYVVFERLSHFLYRNAICSATHTPTTSRAISPSFFLSLQLSPHLSVPLLISSVTVSLVLLTFFSLSLRLSTLNPSVPSALNALSPSAHIKLGWRQMQYLARRKRGSRIRCRLSTRAWKHGSCIFGSLTIIGDANSCYKKVHTAWTGLVGKANDIVTPVS